MTKLRLASAATGLAMIAALIGACSSSTGGLGSPRLSASPTATHSPTASKTVTSSPSASATTTRDFPASPSATTGSAPAGDVTKPGATVTGSNWITYEFSSYDGLRARLSSRIVSLTPATAEQTSTLVREIPQLKGYDVTLVVLEQKKLSGDAVAYYADYTDYDIATVAGDKGLDVTVFGWHDCDTSSFTKAFDRGETITSCFVGASVPGGDPIAGLLYTGSSAADDNPYDSYDGKPVFMNFLG